MYLKNCEWKELEGKTILSTKDVNTLSGFWGDSAMKIRVVTNGGVFYLETGGGSNLFGFPGSQNHGVWLYRLERGSKKGKSVSVGR